MNDMVSVIIPVYNGEKYLKRCLESVINQTYANIEIIVINDGSKDKSLSIIEEYKKKDNRIILINQENMGVSASRNNAIKMCSGQYTMFVDCDDWLEQNMVEKMVEIIKQENVDAVRCNYYRNYLDGTEKNREKYDTVVTNKILNRDEIKENILIKIINGKLPAYIWLLIVKTEILKKIKPFNINLAMMEDTIFYIDMLTKINSFYIINDCLYHYFCNNDSASKSSNNYLRNFKNILLVNSIEKKYLEMLDCNDCFYKEMYTTHAKMIENICYNIFKTNNKSYTMKCFYDIVKNEEVKTIFNNSNLKELKINKRISASYIKKGDVKKLYNYYKNVYKLSKLKDKILNRKE